MIVRLMLLLPWLISPAASEVMWHQLMNERNGIVNYWLVLFGLPALGSAILATAIIVLC